MDPQPPASFDELHALALRVDDEFAKLRGGLNREFDNLHREFDKLWTRNAGLTEATCHALCALVRPTVEVVNKQGTDYQRRLDGVQEEIGCEFVHLSITTRHFTHAHFSNQVTALKLSLSTLPLALARSRSQSQSHSLPVNAPAPSTTNPPTTAPTAPQKPATNIAASPPPPPSPHPNHDHPATNSPSATPTGGVRLETDGATLLPAALKRG
ncbi:MAG: hypothetical protein L6R37_006406 [Teloschistes peruensis]|nr:MAG: hypothetical protein L6R37_006406 [Teloschistes peruensis]